MREYGLRYYSLFWTLEPETARPNGNYLIGLDYGFYKFPRGIISLEFNTSALTRDMSMVQIEGNFAGRLVASEVPAMYQSHGFEYLEFLRASAEEFTREAVELYSLSELISSRSAIENNVKGEVCLRIQSEYLWVQCDYVSLGRVGANIPEPELLSVERGYEEEKLRLLERQMLAQKKLNFFNSGGSQLLANLERLDSELFLNVTRTIVEAANILSVTGNS